MASGVINKQREYVYLNASKNITLTANTGQNVSILRSDFAGLSDTDNVIFAVPGLGSGTSVHQSTFMGYSVNTGTGTSTSIVAAIRLYSTISSTVTVTVRILVER